MSNEVNLIDGVEVRVLTASAETIKIEVRVASESDAYETNIEVDDRVWLGDARWLVAENLSTSDRQTNERAEAAPVARLVKLTSEEDLEAPGDAHIDSLSELASDAKLRILRRNG